ncbi:DUF2341 domain-containing protein, partial [Acidobacteria bacterium AH-259-L09]|nr:DUF2341 domain-containing protein [Acidobacteria bacterium AH-259-L09]
MHRKVTFAPDADSSAAPVFGSPTTVHSGAVDSLVLSIDRTSTPDKIFAFYVKNGVAGDVFFKSSPVDTISFGAENTLNDGTESLDFLSVGRKDWSGDSKFQLSYTTQTSALVRFYEVDPVDPGLFGFRKSITIDRTKISDASCGTTLSNFPLLFSVTDPDLRTTANGGGVTDAEGDDIIFRAPDAATCAPDGAGCGLDHEIEKYDGSTGQLVAWVRVPSVNTNDTANTSDTVINIYYGNSDVTSSSQNATGVWDANYLGVWHLNQDPGPGGADDMADSTSNANHATAAASMVTADLVDAKIGQGIDFDGLGDVIEDADGENYINGLTGFTLSAWIQSDVIATDKGFVTGAAPTGSDDAFSIRYDDAGASGGGDDVVTAGVTVGAAKVIESSALVQTLNWQHVSLTWASGGQLTLYIDGDANTPTFNDSAFSGSLSTADTFLIGVGPNDTVGSAGWDGIVDEVRISNTDRTACWIGGQYNNQFDPGDVGTTGKFYDVGTEEGSPATLAQVTTFTAQGHSEGGVLLQWRTSYEVDNLGFHLYREQGGERRRLTPELVAGSALFAGLRTQLTAGRSYGWWDPQGRSDDQYWLEDVDLDGTRSWNGPVTPASAAASQKGASAVSSSILLSQLARGAPAKTVLLSSGPAQAGQPRELAATLQERQQQQWALASKPAVKLEIREKGW